MSKKLVIVESPTKAKTIGKFLGKDYLVVSSYGHVRDLPKKAAEIPAKHKKEKWSRLGVDVDNEFKPLYVIPTDKKKRVKEIKDKLKGCEEIFLATDEDREGESISWHLLEVLKPKIKVKRLVFHEITKQAISKAFDSAREIDMNLVKAQETRRVIDRLFGYTVSPLLWKKMAPRLSAGRVQSVAMRLLVERERERMQFNSAEYWDLKAEFDKGGSSFEAELVEVDNKRIAQGKDFDPKTGKLKDNTKVVLLDKKKAKALETKLKESASKVAKVESKPYTSRPYPPFVTSTLQQEGSRKLRFSARRTMQVAQKLYENGFITYMRTDSTTLSKEALDGVKKLVTKEFGKEYLNPETRIYKTKVKNAQEAHEAIRPAGSEFASPLDVKKKLGEEAFRLYELIWKRTLACQMKDAKGVRLVVSIACAESVFKARGKTIGFAGYLRAYVEGSDDPEAELADQEKVLPPLKEEDSLKTVSIEALSHNTQPPSRYTEGSLIKELEARGIGRPSTWASVVDLVLSRMYAFKKGTALVPTFLAIALTGLMERFFTKLVDYSFTALLEDDLDSISRGEADSLKYLSSFYFGNGHPGLQKLVKEGEETIDPRDVCGIEIGKDNEKLVEVRIGRYGAFLTNGEINSGLPEQLSPDELTLERARELIIEAEKGPESLGEHPETGEAIYLKSGRYGPYVQLGEQEEKKKPKMVSLLPKMTMEDVTLEVAIELLSLPKTLGVHPETKEDVLLMTGRFGPYIKSGNENRSVSGAESPLDLTLEEAVEILKQPKGRRKATVLKELGEHPETKKKLSLRSGRYGPYVTDGKTNASLSKDINPDELTLEQAITIFNEKVAKGK